MGERGREVKEFIEQILGVEGLSRSVVVASPAVIRPLMRVTLSDATTAVAEYFAIRDRNVLLLMDSLASGTPKRSAWRWETASNQELSTLCFC